MSQSVGGCRHSVPEGQRGIGHILADDDITRGLARLVGEWTVGEWTNQHSAIVAIACQAMLGYSVCRKCGVVCGDTS